MSKKTKNIIDHTSPTKKLFLKYIKPILSLGALGVALGIASIIISIDPRISVFNNTSLDLSNPLFTTFTVSNDGYSSIHDVNLLLGLKRIETEKGLVMLGDNNFGSRFITSEDHVKTLESGEKYTYKIPLRIFNYHSRIINADVAIVVTYKKFFIKHERIFRYYTEVDANGKLHWFPKPLSG